MVVSFATFVCKPLSEDWTVLDADNTILCEDGAHSTMQLASVLVIAVFAVGVPLCIGCIVLRVWRRYERDTRGLHVKMVTQLAEEMQVDRLVAQYVVRDVSVGSEFSVLINSYKPAFMYWESDPGSLTQHGWRFYCCLVEPCGTHDKTTLQRTAAYRFEV